MLANIESVGNHKLIHGDCLVSLKDISDSSIDAVVTDPPYGLSEHRTEDVVACLRAWIDGKEFRTQKRGFMGRSWDAWVPGPEVWKECLRVLKPGGHLLAFAGTRSVDLMGIAVRLAGFEIRDSILWIHGQGFPKSLNVAKATGKDQWSGWGTGLKPAHEPILLCRKTLDGTVAENVEKWGVGGINVDGCRIATSPIDAIEMQRCNTPGSGQFQERKDGIIAASKLAPRVVFDVNKGRFPANVVLSHSPDCVDLGKRWACVPECPVRRLDKQGIARGVHSAGSKKGPGGWDSDGGWGFIGKSEYGGARHGDNGGPSRFFYCAKASKQERGEGNNHPTVKPLALMRYLVRLVQPPSGGAILDPFMGSGTTGVAVVEEGGTFIGIEAEDDSFRMSMKRVRRASEGQQLALAELAT